MKWFRIIAVIILSIIVMMFLIGAILPEKHSATASATFQSSPDVVWTVITDFANASTWRQDVNEIKMTGTSTFREVSTDGDTVDYQIEESIPAAKLVTRIITPGLPYGGAWTYELMPEGNGCTLRITEDGEVYNPMFRFLSKYAFGHSATMESYLEALKTKIQ